MYRVYYKSFSSSSHCCSSRMTQFIKPGSNVEMMIFVEDEHSKGKINSCMNESNNFYLFTDIKASVDHNSSPVEWSVKFNEGGYVR